MQIADTVLKEFISEFNEMLDRLSMALATSASHPQQIELVRSIYRDIHTIKGNAMMFGLPLSGKLAHAIENLLDYLRLRKTPLSSETITQLLQGLDCFQQISRSLSQHQQEPAIGPETEALVQAFERLYEREVAADAKVSALDSASSPAASQLVIESERPEVVRESTPKSSAPVAEEAPQETIRVNLQVLDNIMNMVGELVLVKNQLQQRVRNVQEEDVQISQRLNSITAELQSEVMKTRMQPVGTVLNKFHRICRDLASELKKDISLEIQGAETELDRALLEAIRDPLMHIVRNSIDHGIETPDERRRSSKTPQGKVAISAFHEGGQVIIQIRDNGKGIDLERVRKKAIEKGLMSADKAAQLDEKSILALVFSPGFSTAEKVSNVSGRGVGMDVVKTNIERVGGTVELESHWRQGTTTTLRIPLTLAIIPALIVGCCEQSFAIPQGRIVELIQIDPQRANGQQIEAIEGSPFIRLRGQLIPLVPLQQLFQKVPAAQAEGISRREANILSIVILSSEGSTFGAMVDQIFDSTDIVVKPLGLGLDTVKLFSGATILGDGSIALTLDVTGVAELAKVRGKSKNPAEGKAEFQKSRLQESTDYLLVKLNGGGRFVIPLSTVHRLEKIALSDIQNSGDFKVCLYRDAILPVFSLSQAVGYPVETEAADASIVVLSKGGRLFGLRVEGILDIMNSAADIDTSVGQQSEICGGFIHESEVYTIVDPFAVLAAMRAIGGEASQPDALVERKRRTQREKRRILLAEDSRFFRQQISLFLEESGYTVVAAEDGRQALDLFSTDGDKGFDLLLSDIEMPHMSGLQLAAALRSTAAAQTLPMIAITSRFSEADISLGKQAGFDCYLEKLNREELIKNIDASLGVVA